MQAILEVTSGPHMGRRIALSPGVAVRIGRTAKADYVVAEDTFLSGAHFYVEWSGEQCVVRDLNSSNGTFLNGTRLSEGVVREGDIITAGQSSFALHVVAAGDMAAMPPPPTLDQTRQIPAPHYYEKTPKPDTEPLPPPFGAAPAPAMAASPKPEGGLSVAQRGMLNVLRGLADPIFAVVDGSAAASFIDAVRRSGGAVEVLSETTPACIVNVNPESGIAEQLAAEGWGKGWGIFVMSRQPLAIVRNHLRRFHTLLSQDGAEFEFRLHNPALIRSFLPTLSGAEAKTFFGPIGAILTQGNTADELMLFMPGPEGTLEKTIPLTTG